MKKYYVSFLLFLPALLFSQKSPLSFFDTIDKSNMSTHILYDRVYPLADLTSENTYATANRISQALYELSKSDFNERFLPYQSIKTIKKQHQIKNTIPLSVIITELEKINISAYEEGFLCVDTAANFSELQILQNTHFDKHQVLLAGALIASHRELSVQFELPKNLIFNTTPYTISSIKVDFGNKKIIPVEPNVVQTIQYKTAGTKNLIFYITLDNGNEYILESSIEIINTNIHKSSLVVETIESTIPFQGYDESQAHTGIGEYEIYLDNVDGIFDKPIILIDGFDPGDSRGIESMYSLLDYQGGTENLADEARDLGYDVVLLNFPVYQRANGDIIDGGADYIQRNAFILIELINRINDEKVGNEELVIIGPSMGGLISRYALKYMENENIEHETRLWLSFDSPHLGANIAIGFQHLMNYVAYGPLGDVTLQEAIDLLFRNPAAKQMLLDHIDGHLLPGDPVEFDPTIVLPTGAPNFRTVFQNELNTLGFPQQTRNIAISNGSGNSTTTGTPGMNVIDFEFYPDGPGGNTRALIDLYFTPSANQTERISRIRSQFWLFTWITLSTSEAFSMSPSHTDGLDSAPGGQFDIGALAAIAGEIPVIQDFLDNLNIDKFNFIPTLSSLAITATNNWYESVDENDITVFQNTYIPNENELHVTLTEENMLFAKEEIFINTSSINDERLLNIRLKNNPVSQELTLIGNLQNSNLKIADLTGKILFEETHSFDNSIVIPIDIASGLYILSISQDELGSKQIKFVVK